MDYIKTLLIVFLGCLYYVFFKLLLLTVNLRIVNQLGRSSLENGSMYFATWHGNLIASTIALQKTFTAMQNPITLIVADNFGGRVYGFAYRKIHGFNVVYLELDNVTRSFKKIKGILNENMSIAMTADGPKAPRHTLRRGSLAIMKQRTTILMSVNYAVPVSIFWRWDKMMVPLPFFLMIVKYSDPDVVTDSELAKAVLSS